MKVVGRRIVRSKFVRWVLLGQVEVACLYQKIQMKRSSFEKRLCDRGIWDILQVCHCVLFDINMIPPYPFKVKHECNMPRVGMDGYVDTHRNKKEAKCAFIK